MHCMHKRSCRVASVLHSTCAMFGLLTIPFTLPVCERYVYICTQYSAYSPRPMLKHELAYCVENKFMENPSSKLSITNPA